MRLVILRVVYDFCLTRAARATKVAYDNRKEIVPSKSALTDFDSGYDCRRVLKHVLKSYDIFRVACDCRKVVVGLIYTTRFVL